MKNKTVLITTVFVLLGLISSSDGWAKKLLDEDYDALPSDNYSPSKSKTSAKPGSQRLKKMREMITRDEEKSQGEVRVPFKEAEDGLEMRKIRRVGVGLQAAGALGFGGALMEMNFTRRWSFALGIGGGNNFQATEFQAKYVLAGEWLLPYMSFGFSRWFSIKNNGPIGKTAPSFLADRLLTDQEKASGEFGKNLVYPGLGLQIIQLKGDWAGASVYAE